jgi:hypothetical protein
VVVCFDISHPWEDANSPSWPNRLIIIIIFTCLLTCMHLQRNCEVAIVGRVLCCQNVAWKRACGVGCLNRRSTSMWILRKQSCAHSAFSRKILTQQKPAFRMEYPVQFDPALRIGGQAPTTLSPCIPKHLDVSLPPPPREVVFGRCSIRFRQRS